MKNRLNRRQIRAPTFESVKKKTKENFGEMANIYHIIRAAALVVGFGYTAQQDRKTWLWGDSVLWGCYAVGIFLFPESVVNKMGGETDKFGFTLHSGLQLTGL